MQYINYYESTLGNILLVADDIGLTGLWFDGQKYYPDHLDTRYEEKNTTILEQTKEWLDIYFSGKEPDFMPEVHLTGSIFQLSVWNILRQIPYGKTMTYRKIARIIANHRGLVRMPAQAVGGAVAHNKISIIIPCHRVVGTNGSLTGYAGGIDKKAKLLSLEKADMSRLFIPVKETVL